LGNFGHAVKIRAWSYSTLDASGSVARMGAVFGGRGRFRARGAEWQGAGAKCPAAGRGPMKG